MSLRSPFSACTVCTSRMCKLHIEPGLASKLVVMPHRPAHIERETESFPPSAVCTYMIAHGEDETSK